MAGELSTRPTDNNQTTGSRQGVESTTPATDSAEREADHARVSHGQEIREGCMKYGSTGGQNAGEGGGGTEAQEDRVVTKEMNSPEGNEKPKLDDEKPKPDDAVNTAQQQNNSKILQQENTDGAMAREDKNAAEEKAITEGNAAEEKAITEGNAAEEKAITGTHHVAPEHHNHSSSLENTKANLSPKNGPGLDLS